ncbi:uncharacterized protein DDB_G0284459 [Chelonus insularis]|uniref:uncharacterized protein DDB_G0284459 n=1 Tax=Chelonus insularis TaxID=460826 RepID=UPI00158C2638|nr:uncharacterized protein DDB_G0284459 [Chelonus insularis]
MKRLKMHSDVVLRNISLGILCFMIVATNQEEIKPAWNNRLYPTNFVYEAPQSSLQSSFSDNVVFSRTNEASRDIGRVPRPQEDEEEYEDYEEEAYDSQNEPKVAAESKETRYETKDDVVDDYDAEYYDDYDNGTNSQLSDSTVDYAPVESIDPEKVKNSSESEAIKENPQIEGPSKAKEQNSHESAVVNKDAVIEEAEVQYSSESSSVQGDPMITEQNVSESTPTREDVEIQNPEVKNLNSEAKAEDQNQTKNVQKKERDEEEDEERILIGEAVVSVVTTKSVVNGTFSVPTPMPMTTEQMVAPPVNLNTSTETPEVLSSSLAPNTPTTEDSMIVASVQTSRSISGARFLPFNLNNDDNSTGKNTSDNNNKTQTFESTESIIDKLDRVQSELSSGFLSGGFRTAGNALQLDVLSEQRPSTTRKSFTTTGRTPVINKFVPRRYNDRRTSIATTETPVLTSSESQEMLNDQASTERPKSPFRIPWPGSTRSRVSSTTEPTKKTTRKPFGRIKGDVQDISAFLPPGYKLKKEDQTTEKSILNDILAKSNVNISALLPKGFKETNRGGESGNNEKKSESNNESKNSPLQSLFTKSIVDISGFLPPGYNEKRKDETSNEQTKKERPSITTASTPIQKSLQELFSKSSVDISALLPPGYKAKNTSESFKETSQKKDELSLTTVSTLAETTKTGGVKLVFPSRPGGRKAVPKATTASNRVEAPGPVTPKIQKGWPTRATTEFTGWPTVSTTPISIEKLLEAARTATVSSMNSSVPSTTSEASTSTSTTTTTTTIRPTTPGICEEECEVAGTIRIIGNATWVPELLDRNTREWQQLADEIEKEMNLVFLKSAILRKWYKNIRIDAFSQGSILVDYFIELQDLRQKINTQEIKVLFHESLRTYNAHKWNETRTKTPMRLGNFLIDPKSTDFIVIPKITLPQQIGKDDRLIPQWAIAVIVIGVGGLLFIIVFGVSVLVNRQNASKLKPPITGMYGEEAAKNIIQSSHVPPSHRSQDYSKSEISTTWNETDAWREKSFESNSNKILMDGMLPDNEKYNVYDSWRSDWNGYYYQPSHTSSKFAGYESTANFSRHPPDYDTNF